MPDPAKPAEPAKPAAAEPAAPAAPAEPKDAELESFLDVELKVAKPQELEVSEEVEDPTAGDNPGEKPAEEKPAEKPVAAAKPTEKPTEKPAEAPVDEVDPLEDMRAQLNEMARGKLAELAEGSPMQAGAPAVSSPGAPSAPAAAAAPPAQPAPQGGFAGVLSSAALGELLKKLDTDQVFLTPEEIDQVIDNPKLIQAAMNKVYKQSTQGVLELVPMLFNSMISDYMAAQNFVNNFYEQNKDLAPFREFVAYTHAREKAKPENKDKSQSDILANVAKEARKTLRLPDPTEKPKPAASGKKKPAFAGAKPGGRTPVERTPAAKQPTQQDYMADILGVK